MNANVPIHYSLASVMEELGVASGPPPSGLLSVRVTDKFFVGGGCEYVMLENPRVENISICSKHAVAAAP
jgi:hypothetical protein